MRENQLYVRLGGDQKSSWKLIKGNRMDGEEEKEDASSNMGAR